MRNAILYGSDALMARRAADAGMDKQGELMKNWKTSAEKILTTGPVVPVIVVNKLEHAVPMAKALVAGGVRVLEVTLRTPVAMEALRLMIKEVPDAIVGAGTVINTQQLQEVTEAGAQFVISPGITGAADSWHQHRFRTDDRHGLRPARV